MNYKVRIKSITSILGTQTKDGFVFGPGGDDRESTCRICGVIITSEMNDFLGQELLLTPSYDKIYDKMGYWDQCGFVWCPHTISRITSVPIYGKNEPEKDEQDIPTKTIEKYVEEVQKENVKLNQLITALKYEIRILNLKNKASEGSIIALKRMIKDVFPHWNEIDTVLSMTVRTSKCFHCGDIDTDPKCHYKCCLQLIKQFIDEKMKLIK
jgi:hypothetical protein